MKLLPPFFSGGKLHIDRALARFNLRMCVNMTTEPILFSKQLSSVCNCSLDFVYSDLAGRQSGHCNRAPQTSYIAPAQTPASPRTTGSRCNPAASHFPGRRGMVGLPVYKLRLSVHSRSHTLPMYRPAHASSATNCGGFLFMTRIANSSATITFFSVATSLTLILRLNLKNMPLITSSSTIRALVAQKPLSRNISLTARLFLQPARKRPTTQQVAFLMTVNTRCSPVKTEAAIKCPHTPYRCRPVSFDTLWRSDLAAHTPDVLTCV